ncbi:MAG: DsbA family protein [Pseudomonadota bacterium]|nr:DsbA family protein [Pseudomonadota bacterium]
MIRLFRMLATRLSAALLIMAATVFPTAADISDVDREELNKMFEAFILANPEVVREALVGLAEREAAERQLQAMAILRDDAGDPFLGNPDASMVIYEFSDYNCGYCKRVFQPLQDLIASDGDIKVVIKEFPILSQSSVLAAQAGIAAQAQDVFPAFHGAMMTARGAISMDSILDAARSAGADLDRLQADMKSPEVAAIIERTRMAATQLEISGTPGLVIGSQVIPGAISLEQMRDIIAAERASNG